MKKISKVLVFALALTLCVSPLLENRASAVYSMGKTGYFPTISAGYASSMAIMSNGDVYTWGSRLLGYDTYPAGGVVIGNTFIMPTPSKVAGLSNVVAAICGAAVTADGDLYIWGGVGNLPTKIPGLSNVTAISTGLGNYAAITANGDLYTWGYNEYGMLGLSDTQDRNSPTKVPGLSKVVGVSLGDFHSAAITADGDLYTWGTNNNGRLGLGYEGKEITTPTKVPGLSNIVAVSLGMDHSAAITANGDLYTWGFGYDGRLGLGDEDDRYSPTKVPGLSNVTAVCAGPSGTAAVTANGDLYVWGGGTYMLKEAWGAYGYHDGYGPPFIDGLKMPLTPYKVQGVKNVAAVSIGYDHYLVLTKSGDIYSWGKASGQLGLGRGVGDENGDVLVPQLVMSGVMQPTGSIVQTLPPTSDNPSSWAEADVTAAVTAGLVPSSLQSKYTQATTRAEFCALAVALYENVTGGAIAERTTFNDTGDVNVQKMGALGVVTGVGNGNFAPDQKLTREQAATMLSRLADALGKPLNSSAATFTDNGSISSWAIEGVGQVQAAGIMSGVGNNTFSPKTDYTREQSIVTILRLFNAVK